MRHHFWMLLACILPLLLVFLLPALGFGLSGWSTVLLLVGCLVLHLFMMRGHGHHGDDDGGPHADH